MKNGTKIIFPLGKKIYKGNLHSHSTRSDGFYSPESIIEGYKKRSYHFICLSDHIRYYYSTIKDNEDFIILDGMEGERYPSLEHVHAIADYSIETDNRYPADVELIPEKKLNLQETIEEYRSRGNICIFNHPRWSSCDYQEMLEISGCLGIEVYNTGCDLEDNTGYSIDYWDYALKEGKRLYAFASDDAHGDDMGANRSSYFGGWINVASDALTQIDIVDSIKKGDFYASTGPEIHRIERKGDQINVFTSPVRSIRFITDHPHYGHHVYDQDFNDISFASFFLKGNLNYLRIEAVDRDNRTAWSNPLFF